MKITWAILAEGIGTDSKGAFTAIGLGQNLFYPQAFPAATKRALVVHLEEEGADENLVGMMRFTFSVKSPSNEVLSAQTGQVQLDDKPWPHLPASLVIPAEVAISVSEPGTYSLEMQVHFPDGSTDHVSLSLYALEAAASQ